ncbi:hypothetical protein HK101_000579 [Irineochytrium annulatum]|nr:hypothetical protein HK101_000579 [Irineochytrium annulatum]
MDRRLHRQLIPVLLAVLAAAAWPGVAQQSTAPTPAPVPTPAVTTPKSAICVLQPIGSYTVMGTVTFQLAPLMNSSVTSVTTASTTTVDADVHATSSNSLSASTSTNLASTTLAPAIESGAVPGELVGAGPPILVTVNLEGLVPLTSHGLHVHTFGDISDILGANLFYHFNPSNRSHTCDSLTGHAGDFGNITSDASGNVHRVTYLTTSLSLNPEHPNSVMGRSVAVHADADDCVTQSSGNSGGRMAQCVVGYMLDGDGDGAAAGGSHSDARRLGTRKNQKAKSVADPGVDAIAVLSPLGTSTASGTIRFHQPSPTDPVLIAASLTGLPPNCTIGVRFHSSGDISSQTGLSVDPEMAFGPVGKCPGTGWSGDVLLNDTMVFVTDRNGEVDIDADKGKYLSLSGISLFSGMGNSVVGRGVALHTQVLNCQPQPANFIFLAQAVVGLRNSSLGPAFGTGGIIPTSTAASGVAERTIDAASATVDARGGGSRSGGARKVRVGHVVVAAGAAAAFVGLLLVH